MLIPAVIGINLVVIVYFSVDSSNHYIGCHQSKRDRNSPNFLAKTPRVLQRHHEVIFSVERVAP